MRVLIITDSLSIPRVNVSYEETYVYKLKEKFKDIEFFHLGFGGATMKDMHKQLGHYYVLKPELIFIQCGIVDCAPRAFSKFESNFITKIKFNTILRPFTKFIKRIRNHNYTSKGDFKKYIKNMHIKAKTVDSELFKTVAKP